MRRRSRQPTQPTYRRDPYPPSEASKRGVIAPPPPSPPSLHSISGIQALHQAALFYFDSRSILVWGSHGNAGRVALLNSARGCLARDMPSLLRGATFPVGPPFSALLEAYYDTRLTLTLAHDQYVPSREWGQGGVCTGCFQMRSYMPKFADIILLQYSFGNIRAGLWYSVGDCQPTNCV